MNTIRRALVPAAALSLAALPVLGEEETAGALRFSLDYTAETWTTLSGAHSSGEAYLDNVDAVLEADLGSLVGWRDTRAVAYALYNNGRDFGGRYVGDLQGISNIETGVEAVRIFEAFVETRVGARGSLLVGLYDLNSEFDALETSGLFIHSAHGIGTEIAQTGIAGPSIFPVSSLAVRYEHAWNARWRTRAAVLDAVPGDPQHPAHTAIELGENEGALVVAETERSLEDGKLLGGAWRYTAEFPDGLASARLGRPSENAGNHGFYLRGEWRPGPLSWFARVGWAAPRFNAVEWFGSLGAVYEGALASRPEDRVGIAVALAESSDRHRRARALAGMQTASRELAFELTYEMPVGDRVVLQPDLQYIVNPGLDPTADDAWALGLRIVLSLR